MICTKQKASSPSIYARTSERGWSTTGKCQRNCRNQESSGCGTESGKTKARLMPKHVATIVPFADSNKSSWLFSDGSIEYTSSATEKKADLLWMVLQELEKYRFNN